MSGTTDQFEGGCLCGAVFLLRLVNRKACTGATVKVAAGIPGRRLRSLSHSNARLIR
jgi:hypothetical protein